MLGIELLLKVTGLGMVSQAICMILDSTGNRDMKVLVSIAAFCVALSLILPEISKLLDVVTTIFYLK